MKAVVYHGQSDIRVEEVPTPIPSDDNIIVKTLCCLICGTDLKIWTIGNPKVFPPRILGHEVVGEITHIGAGNRNSDLHVGDRVVVATTISCGDCLYCRSGLGNLCPNTICVGTTYDGAFADCFEIPVRAAHHLIRVPDNVPNEAAAICEPLSCAVNGHEKIGVKAGDSVVIIGGGPLGAIHAELAKAEGASEVFLIGSTRERLELLKKMNGITLIDGSEGTAEHIIKDRTNGLGADKVIVCAPIPKAFEDAFLYVRKGGGISHFASLPRGKSELTIDTRTIHYNELTIAGVSDSRPEHVQKAVDYLSSGKMDVSAIITHKVYIDEIIDGLQLMKNRECLKVAVYPDREQFDKVKR